MNTGPGSKSHCREQGGMQLIQFFPESKRLIPNQGAIVLSPPGESKSQFIGTLSSVKLFLINRAPPGWNQQVKSSQVYNLVCVWCHRRIISHKDTGCVSFRCKYVRRMKGQAFSSKTSDVLMFKMVVGVVIVCADETLWLCVAELGRDALSIQAAPHDPGTGLQ